MSMHSHGPDVSRQMKIEIEIPLIVFLKNKVKWERVSKWLAKRTFPPNSRFLSISIPVYVSKAEMRYIIRTQCLD